ALHPVERIFFPHLRLHLLRLRIDQAESNAILTKLREIGRREHIELAMLQMRETSRGEIIEARCRVGEQTDVAGVVAELRSLPGVRAVRFGLATRAAGRRLF